MISCVHDLGKLVLVFYSISVWCGLPGCIGQGNPDPRVLNSHPRQCTASSPCPAAGWLLRNSPCATLGPAPVPASLLETRPCMWTGPKVCHLELSLHFLLHISLSDIYIYTHIYKYADFPLHKVIKCYITSKRGFTMGESLHSKCLLTTANQFHEHFVL